MSELNFEEQNIIKNISKLDENILNFFFDLKKKSIISWEDMFYQKMSVNDNYLKCKNFIIKLIIDNNSEIKLLKIWSNLLRDNYSINNNILFNYFDFKEILKYRKPDENKIYYSQSSFQKNDYLSQFYSILELKKYLFELSFGILDNDFDWSNILMAGGILLHPTKKSDIDLWIYGADYDIKKKKIDYCLNYFKEKSVGKTIYFLKNKNLISIYITDVPRNFQIICANFVNKFDVIKNFDFDCLHTIYDGENLLTTYECIKSLIFQTIFKIYWKPKKYRLCKLYLKGFSFSKKIIRLKFPELNGTDFIDYLTKLVESNQSSSKFYYPTNGSIHENIEKIKKIFEFEIVTIDSNEIIVDKNYNLYDLHLHDTNMNFSLKKLDDKYIYHYPVEIKNNIYQSEVKKNLIFLSLQNYPNLSNLFTEAELQIKKFIKQNSSSSFKFKIFNIINKKIILNLNYLKESIQSYPTYKKITKLPDTCQIKTNIKILGFSFKKKITKNSKQFYNFYPIICYSNILLIEEKFLENIRFDQLLNIQI